MSERNYKYSDLKLFWTSSDHTGCGYLRSYLPSEFLKQYHDTVYYSWGFPANHPDLFKSDVIHIQRANHEYFQTFIPEIQKQGKKVIMDLDDTVWDIPATNLSHRHYPKKEIQKIDAVIKLCNCLTVSTEPLKEFLSSRFPDMKIFIIPNHLPHNELIEKKRNDKIKIGYSGSYSHAGDFNHYFVDTLRYIKQKYKDQIELFIHGHQFQWSKNLMEFIPWTDTLSYFPKTIENNWDIGLIVAKDNMFNKVKSNLKYIEYSRNKCVSIAHKTYPYLNTITHGENGYLIDKDKTDWKEFLCHLIENPEERMRVANNAYDLVKEKFTYEHNVKFLEDKYTEIFDFLYSKREETNRW